MEKRRETEKRKYLTRCGGGAGHASTGGGRATAAEAAAAAAAAAAKRTQRELRKNKASFMCSNINKICPLLALGFFLDDIDPVLAVIFLLTFS